MARFSLPGLFPAAVGSSPRSGDSPRPSPAIRLERPHSGHRRGGGNSSGVTGFSLYQHHRSISLGLPRTPLEPSVTRLVRCRQPRQSGPARWNRPEQPFSDGTRLTQEVHPLVTAQSYFRARLDAGTSEVISGCSVVYQNNRIFCLISQGLVRRKQPVVEHPTIRQVGHIACASTRIGR